MGLYFKDLTLPPTCSMCPMCKVDDLGYFYSYCTDECRDIPNFGMGGRPDWCPALEIKTPHGNLFDVEHAKKKFISMSWSVQGWISEVDLSLLPVIIPAEEERITNDE